MKICITGGAGMIGSALLRKLNHNNHEIIVIDNLWRGKIEYLKHWISWHPVALDHPLYQENQKRIEEIYNFEKEYLSKSWRFKYDVYKKRLSKYLKKSVKELLRKLKKKYFYG